MGKQYVGKGRMFSSSTIEYSTILFNEMKKSLKDSNVPYQVTDIDDTNSRFLMGMTFVNALAWIRLPSHLKENKPSRNMSYMSIEKSARAVLAGLYGMMSVKKEVKLPSDVSTFLDDDWYYTLILKLRFCYKWKSLKSINKEKKQSRSIITNSEAAIQKDNKEGKEET